MKKFSIKQLNNLITGNRLSTEIPSTSNDLRAFIVIGAYITVDSGHMVLSTSPSKYLNSKEKENLLFYFRKYEIEKKYIENNWDVTHDELINSTYLEDIKSIEELETQVGKFIEDFSQLDNEWKFENPI